MKISFHWLNEFLHTDLPLAEVFDTITMGGLEIEAVHDLGMVSGKIVVSHVLECVPHPDSDHLNLCKVDVGTGTALDIVCGAANARAGIYVPCALIGAVLPGGMEIARRKVRGQVSEGMLCSAKELGLGNDHAGIMELPEDYKIGAPFDCIIDIKVTPNRADCLSVLGLARDIGGMLGKKVFPPTPRFKEMLDHIEGYVRLSIKARTECPRYACRLLRGVKVGESPLWLRRALETADVRSISNVVDVTNYVLHELGHPLHAFDFDKISGSEIQVRLARAGEKLTLLDGREIELHAEDLVIADAQRAVALAGIMGGRESEVTELTTNVLLESAYFDPATIRRTARRHNLNTEASYRFERGTDRQRVLTSLGRATQLIQEMTGCEVAKGQLDLQGPATELPAVVLETKRVNDLLGLSLASSEIADFLVNVGFEIRRSDRESMIVAVPSYRVDVTRDVDLIEEIARLYSYNKIPSTMPRIVPSPVAADPLAVLTREARRAMASLGFFEAVTYSFVSEQATRATGADPEKQPRLANPLTIEQAVMRASLLPGLLEAVQFNQRQGGGSGGGAIQLFETGKTWSAASTPGNAAGEGYELLALATGEPAPHWAARPQAVDFYEMKGAAEALLRTWSSAELTCTAPAEPGNVPATLHPGRSAQLSWLGERIGELGELHPDVTQAFDLKGSVYMLRLDLAAILRGASKSVMRFQQIPRFPGSERDLALVLDRGRSAGQVIETVRDAGGPLLADVSVFDLYEGDKIDAGKKSLALRLSLRSPEKTLTDEEISGAVERIVKKLQKQCGAVLRT